MMAAGPRNHYDLMRIGHKTLLGEIQAEFFVCDQNPTQFAIEHGVCDSHDVGDD